MKNIAKMLLGFVCLMAVAAVSAMGTLAWLTDRDVAVNTFTVGQVDITVDEAKVNADGTPVEGAERVQTNEYHLIPGCTYTKDPTLTVQANSVDSHIRMILTVHNASGVQSILDRHQLGDFSALIGGWDQEVWLYHGFAVDDASDTISFEFRYHQTVGAEAESVVLPALFDRLIVPGEITGEEIRELYEGGFKMEIFGHAIQSAGFESEDTAWESFDRQMNPLVFNQM